MEDANSEEMSIRRPALRVVMALCALLVVGTTACWVLLQGERRVVVVLRSDPARATVFEHGREISVTPARFVLTAGERRAVRLVCRNCVDRYVVIDANEFMAERGLARLRRPFEEKEHEILVALSRGANAGLIVTTEPEGAEVFLDGMRLGVTPLSRKGLVPGSRVLRLIHPACYPEREAILLEAGAENRVHRMLRNTVVALYTGLIAKEPGKLTHYTELAHYYVLNARFAEAEKVLDQGLEALGLPLASDKGRYVQELWKIYVRQYRYPEESEGNQIRPACRRLMKTALERKLHNAKQLRNYLKAMDRYDKSHGR